MRVWQCHRNAIQVWLLLLLIEQKMCSALLYIFPIISSSLSLSYQNHLRANKAVCSCCGWMTSGNVDHSEMLFLYYCFTLYESCVSQHAVVREVWWHMRMHLNVYSLDEKLMYLCLPRWSCWCTNKSWLQRETEGISEKERGQGKRCRKGGRNGCSKSIFGTAPSCCVPSSLIIPYYLFSPHWRAARKQGCRPWPGQGLSAWDSITLISPPLQSGREQVSNHTWSEVTHSKDMHL